MSLSRQHFYALASAVAHARECVTDDSSPSDVVDCVAAKIADELRQFNRAFDRNRFLDACGVNDD